MGERLERVMLFAEMHSKARVKAGKSQEYMALELGVAKKTVQNWEKGISSPSFFQSLEWFRVLNVNPFPYYLSIIYPHRFESVKNATTDEEINEAFKTLVENLGMTDKRTLLYIYYGDHGGAAHSLLQMMLAYLHTPLQTRITQAILNYHVYEMERERGNLICIDEILPNMEDLHKAIKRARISALEHEYGYTVIDEGMEEETGDVITTVEELEAYGIIKSILRQTVYSRRIVYRDTTSYFSILLDDDSHKWICRLYLDDSKKYMVIADENKVGIRYDIDDVDDIYSFTEELIESCKKYL